MALALGLAGAAHAQDTTTVSGVTVSGQAGTLGAITTTGSRLDLTPLETPASVEVLTGETIRARGDLTVMEAVSRATGVTSVGTPGDGGGALSARGFSGLGSVMQLYDGVRLYVGAGTITFPFDPWTVDRIEVLRGPASVMFGEGAIGGAVNVVPRRPDAAMRESQFQLGVGSFGEARIAIGTGGPLTERLAYRIDVSHTQADNWVDRGESDSWAFSGALRWQVTPTFALTLTDDYGYQKPMQYFGTPLINHVLLEETRHRNYDVSDARLRYKDNWLQLKAEWTPAEGISVRNDLYRLTTDRLWRNAESYFWNGGTEIDRLDYIAIGHDQTQTGDRLGVTFDHDLGGMKNSLALGAEANKIKFTHTSNTPFQGESFIDALQPVPGTFIFVDPFVPRFHTDTDQAAIFAEDRLALTDQWSVVGGIRADRAKLTRTDLVARTAFSKTFDTTDWRVGVVYARTPSLSFYAQYSTGSDPVGSLITLSVSQKNFDLSSGRQYEVGVKQVFMGGLGEWSLALYDISKKKLLTRDPRNPAITQQVGERTSKGFEATLALAPTPAWTIEANATALQAEFADFTESVGGRAVSRNGKTPPNVPETTANLWLGWAFAPGWKARLGGRYVGRMYSDNANTFVLPSHTVVDASLNWAVRDGLDLTLRVTNAFDEIYPITAYNDEQWILGRPRAVELTLSGRF